MKHSWPTLIILSTGVGESGHKPNIEVLLYLFAQNYIIMYSYLGRLHSSYSTITFRVTFAHNFFD